MPNASFGAVPFDVLGDNPFDWPQPDRANELVVRHVPYGSRTIEQDLGPLTQEIAYPVALTAATYAALDSMRLAATLATLTVGDDPPHPGARLQAIGGRTLDTVHDLVLCQLTFRVLT